MSTCAVRRSFRVAVRARTMRSAACPIMTLLCPVLIFKWHRWVIGYNSSDMSKRTKAAGTKTLSGHGYDFGAELHALIVPGPDLTSVLTQAGIIGCAYGLSKVPEIPQPLPLITLVGTDAQQMRLAFNQFHRWASAGGGDAVELTFIFLTNGGYLLGISPEENRSRQRLSGYDRVYSPITVTPLYVKQLDTRQSFLHEFQDYKQHLISPFLLAAAVTKATLGPNVTPDSIEDLHDVKPLLKFEATILTEPEVQEHTLPSLVLHSASKKRVRPPRSRYHQPEGRDYAKRRQEIIARHFPLTIRRLRATPLPQDIGRESESAQIRSWQVEQAICNLTLSKELCSDLPHYRCIASRKQLIEQVPAALRNRYEGIETPKRTFSATEVIEQVRLDGLALLRELRQKVKSPTIHRIQRLLAQSGFLDVIE